MTKKCIWCLLEEPEITFLNKAHTIPKSLGGQNYNKFVCDKCNAFFGGTTTENNYSIEEALKETFCISRERFLNNRPTKRNIGVFKSKFFDMKFRNGKPRLIIKQSFLLKPDFQKELCRSFKRGLIKMWFEEFDRQSNYNIGQLEKYNLLRDFARHNFGDIPVLYFERRIGFFLMKEREAETPILILNRTAYLYEDEKFTEIEFLGHVFGFPITNYTQDDFNNYIRKSIREKTQFFDQAIIINKLTDIDFTLRILNK